MIRATQDTPTLSTGFRVRDSHPLWSDFPDGSTNLLKCDLGVLQPQEGRNLPGLGSSPFARHYLGNHVCFLFLPVLRCFSSRGLLFAPPRGLSQLTTSFVAYQSPGIHHVPFPTFAIPEHDTFSSICSRHIPSAFYHYINRLSFCSFVCFFLLRSLALFDFSFPVPICQRSTANTQPIMNYELNMSGE